MPFKSISSALCRQGLAKPSAVTRILLHVAQNGSDSGAITCNWGRFLFRGFPRFWDGSFFAVSSRNA